MYVAVLRSAPLVAVQVAAPAEVPVVVTAGVAVALEASAAAEVVVLVAVTPQAVVAAPVAPRAEESAVLADRLAMAAGVASWSPHQLALRAAAPALAQTPLVVQLAWVPPGRPVPAARRPQSPHRSHFPAALRCQRRPAACRPGG